MAVKLAVNWVLRRIYDHKQTAILQRRGWVSREGFEPSTHGLKVSCYPPMDGRSSPPSLWASPLISIVVHRNPSSSVRMAATWAAAVPVKHRPAESQCFPSDAASTGS